MGEEDAGIYECVAENAVDRTSVATEINVVSKYIYYHNFSLDVSLLDSLVLMMKH